MERQRIAAGLVALAILVTLAVVFAADGMTGTVRQPAAVLQYTPPSGGGGGGGGGSGLLPDLHVDARPSEATTPAAGSELDFYVTVSTRNRGGSSNVVLNLNLPDGWTYDHASADRGPGCTGTPPNLACNVGWINPSATTHVTLFGKVAETGTLKLVATVKSLQEPELDPSDNQTTVTVTPQGTTSASSGGTQGTTSPAGPVALKLVGSPVAGAVLRIAKTAGARYQWQLCTPSCKPIRGATKTTLKLLRSYAGKSVRVVVTKGSTTKASSKVRVKLRLR